MKKPEVGAYYVCPKCHKVVVCSCSTCRQLRKEKNVTGFKEIIWDKENDLVICPYCGHKDFYEAFCEFFFHHKIEEVV